MRGFIREAGFFGHEGDGAGGGDARAEGLAGVAIEATGEIDSEDGGFGFRDGLDDGGEGIFGRAIQAGAEEGVDDEHGRVGFDELGSGEDGLDFHGLGDAVIEQGVPLKFVGAGEQRDRHVRAAIVEMSRGGQAVAAVIPRADEDENSRRCSCCLAFHTRHPRWARLARFSMRTMDGMPYSSTAMTAVGISRD